MPRKEFIQKKSTRQAILTGLFVAVIVLGAQAVKDSVEYLINWLLERNGITGMYGISIVIGFIVAASLLVFFIKVFSDGNEEI